MAAALDGYRSLDSVTIVSHGEPGSIALDGMTLDTAGLSRYTKELAQIGAVLSPNGEIRLYGCQTAAGVEGRRFIEALAMATGAVVAGSNNLTGNAELGGDWDLEVSTSPLKAESPLLAERLAEYRHTLPQPVYQSADGYIGESFFTIYFNIALDSNHPPALSSFDLQINGTGASLTGITYDNTNNSIQMSIAGSTLLPGDVIDFVYTDPSGNNDLNALQGLDGTDVASFVHSIVVAITRPGPSAPSAPVLSNSSDTGQLGDNITSNNTPTLTGTAEANAIVKLYDSDGTTVLGTTTANGSGNWSITSSALSEGNHNLRATQTNNQAQTSSLSNGLILLIDRTAPAAPASLAVSAASDSGVLGDRISNAVTPGITGTGEPGARVTLFDTDGSTVLGTATAGGGGAWSITSTSLSEGVHSLTAKQADAAGNISVFSSALVYTLDTVGPSNLALSTTNVHVSNATNGSTVATLSSTDLSTVTYGFVVGNGVIDADNGKFTISGSSLVTAQNLSAGTYRIYVSATDAAGNGSFQTFTITVYANNAPVASNVSLAGTAQVAQQLTGSYTYSDSDQDVQGTSTFRWVRNSVSTGINGGVNVATTQNYTLVNNDQGSYLYFCIRPVALTGTLLGTEVCSTASAAVLAAPINGTCGSAASSPASLLPSANLCSAGTASVVSVGSNQYSWTCSGSNGGTSATCNTSWSNTATGSAQGAVSAPAPAQNNNWVVASAGFASPAASPPANTTLPFGLANFTLNSGTFGSSASVTINYTSAIPAGAVYLKYGKSPEGYNCSGQACSADHWYQLPAGQVAFSQDRKSITLTITDGGVGDNDLNPNGFIVDPGGPAIIGGDANAVPTLSEWGIIVLSGLMAVLTLGSFNRRRIAQ